MRVATSVREFECEFPRCSNMLPSVIFDVDLKRYETKLFNKLQRNSSCRPSASTENKISSTQAYLSASEYVKANALDVALIIEIYLRVSQLVTALFDISYRDLGLMFTCCSSLTSA